MVTRKQYAGRFVVTTEMAEMCISFLMDQNSDGDDYAAPLSVHEAFDDVVSAEANDDDRQEVRAVESFRRAVESWMVIDRAACVGLFGPGLGVEQ